MLTGRAWNSLVEDCLGHVHESSVGRLFLRIRRRVAGRFAQAPLLATSPCRMMLTKRKYSVQ